MYLIFFTLLLLLLPPPKVLSNVAVDPLFALEQLNNLENRPPDRPPCHLKTDCPPPLRELNNQASNAFIYQMVHQEAPVNKCLKNQTILPARELEHTYINTLQTSYTSRHPFQSSCASHVKNAEERQSLLLTQHQYYNERIGRGAIQSLSALHAIDSILDSPSSMNSVACRSHISPKVEKACKKIKQCPRTSQRDAIVELIYSSLVKRQELANSLRQVKNKIIRDTRQKRQTVQDKQNLKNLKDVRDTLETSIAEVESLVPWIQGRIFSQNLSKIEENIKKKGKEQDIKKQIQDSLFRQAKANQKELLRLYDQFGEAADCLQGKNKRCDRFSKIIEKAPPALPMENPYAPPLPADIEKAYNQFEIVQCMEEEVNVAQQYSDIAQVTGEIALGVTIGGVGGVSALAINSARLLRNGYRLKGALSIMGLGTLGITTYKNFNLLKSKCKEASKHIVGLQQISAQASCLPRDYPQNVSQYLSCLTELALSAAAVTPSLTNLKALPGSKSKLNANSKTPPGTKKEVTFKEFKELLNDQEGAEFAKLLEEFNPQELSTIQPYFKFIKEEQIDPLVLHRALRYTRTLSAKKRQQFIIHLDEALKGEGNSVNRHIRAFVRGEKRHTKRVAKFEKKYGYNQSPDAKIKAQRASHKIEDVMLSCRSRNMNASHQRGISVFAKINATMMAGSVTAGFSSANWHLPKDTEWFGRLSYELIYSLMYTKILVKVMGNPSSNLGKRYLEFSKGLTLVEGVDTIMYSQFFNISEDDARDALNRIKNSPEKKKALEQLSQHLDDINFVEKFKKATAENFKKMMETQKKPFEQTEEDLPENLANLRDKDLDDPKVQDELMELIISQNYDSERGYLNLGNMFNDRFVFSRAWSSFFHIPKSIPLGVLTYYALCLTSVYPVQGVAAAAGIQALNKFITADLYYKSRSFLINQ